MSRAVRTVDSIKAFALVFSTGLSLLILFGLYSSLIERAKNPPTIESRPTQQETYTSSISEASLGRIGTWVELGRENTVVTYREGGERYLVETQGLEIGTHWSTSGDAVRWHMRADTSAKLKISPVESESTDISTAEAIAIYFSDDQWNYRSARIIAGSIDIIVSDIYPGKWVLLPIQDIAPNFNKVNISINPLLGYGSLISAVAIIEKAGER